MHNQKLFDRFDNVYEKIFPLIDQKGNRKFNPESITDKNISTLLSWPGALLIEMVKKLGDKKLIDELNDFNNWLKNNPIDSADSETVNNQFYPIKKKFFGVFFLFIHPKTFFLDLNIIKELLFSVSQYFLLICFLIRQRKTKETIISLSLEQVDEISEQYSKISPEDRITASMGLYWLGLAQIIVWEQVQNFCLKEFETSCLKSIKTIGTTDLLMHERISASGDLFGIIEHKTNSTGLGFGLDINYLDNRYFNVWMMEFDENYNQTSEAKPYYGYLLETQFANPDEVTEILAKNIFITAMETFQTADTICDVWGEFIAYPEKKIIGCSPKKLDELFKKYKSWIEAIVKSDNLYEVFRNCSTAYNAIGSVDLKIGDKRVSNARALITEKEKEYIPQKIQEKLKEAYDDINDLVKIIKKNEAMVMSRDKIKVARKKINLPPEDIITVSDNGKKDEMRDFIESRLAKSKHLRKKDADLFIDDLWPDDKGATNHLENAVYFKPFNIVKKICTRELPRILKQLNGNPHELTGNQIRIIIGVAQKPKKKKTKKPLKSISSKIESGSIWHSD